MLLQADQRLAPQQQCPEIIDQQLQETMTQKNTQNQSSLLSIVHPSYELTQIGDPRDLHRAFDQRSAPRTMSSLQQNDNFQTDYKQ